MRVSHVGPLVVALLVACDTSIHHPGAGGPDAGVSAKCREAEQHSDFPWIRDNIFKISCSAFSSCHQGSRAAGKLNLTPTQAYDQLVNKAALEPGWTRVVPGEPAESYLMVKIGGAAGPLGDGGLMPPQNMMLCSQKIAAIERWIEAGALREPVVADAGVVDVPLADAGPDAVFDAPPADAVSGD